MRVARLRRGRGDGRLRLAELIPNFLSPSTSQRWHASAAHVADCARSVSRSGAPESDRGGGAPADRTGATSGRGGGVVSGGTPRRRSGQPARAIAKRCSLLGASLADGRVCSEGLSVVQPTVQTLRHPCSFESRRRVAPSFKPIACAPSSDAPHSRGLRSNFARLPHPSFETSREGWLRPLVCRCDYFGRADIWRTLDAHWSGPKQKTDLCCP